MKAYYITTDTHIRKMCLIADVITDIFKFKNRSVGNFVKCILDRILFSHIIIVNHNRCCYMTEENPVAEESCRLIGPMDTFLCQPENPIKQLYRLI